MHRRRSIRQPAIKFSFYIVCNVRLKIMDIYFLLFQPSLQFSKALDTFRPESADDLYVDGAKIMKLSPAPGLYIGRLLSRLLLCTAD